MGLWEESVTSARASNTAASRSRCECGGQLAVERQGLFFGEDGPLDRYSGTCLECGKETVVDVPQSPYSPLGQMWQSYTPEERAEVLAKLKVGP